MRLPDLLNGLGTAVLDTGGRLSAAQARRLACDACVIPLVLGSDSMPLDVGRQQRLATTALRDALAQRDKGCAFPSCDRPPRHCHHVGCLFSVLLGVVVALPGGVRCGHLALQQLDPQNGRGITQRCDEDRSACAVNKVSGS